MPIALQNLIILGDSLSDIGIKREAPTGMFARAAGAMRTNEIGRYSDGRNWTDFLIEWAGADSLVHADPKATKDASKRHLSLTTHALLLGTQTSTNPPMRYANYAEGGAVAASDWHPMGGALGYLSEQVVKYIEARKALGAQFNGDTMHIVWIGLNDIVTAERSEGITMSSADEPVYVVGRFENNRAGTGITPIVEEIKSLIDRISNAFPDSRDRDHFLLITLPSPTISVRFKDQLADGKKKVVDRFEKNTVRFNELLEFIATYWPHDVDEGPPGANPANISLVRMHDWMKYVAGNAKAFQLTELAQQPGVPVLYRGQQDTVVPPAIRRCLTTSDLAHPTEAVYEIIARKIADDLLAKYTLGRLDPKSWPALQPYSKMAGI
jgi:hypothetical protein